MKFIDYYKVLGVDEDVSEADLKKVYRKSARKYHPDVSKEKDAEEKFKAVSEAYNVLKDPEKRSEYDNLRKFSNTSGEPFTPPPDWQTHFRQDGGAPGDTESFSDFFNSIFGSAGFSDPAYHRDTEFTSRGQDIHFRLGVSLEDAYAGGSMSISVPTQSVKNGRIVTDLRTLNIKLPKGIVNGQHIRLRGQGGKATGSAPDGDLFLEISLKSHTNFSVEGKDVFITIPVAPWEAALGEKITVPTLGGNVNLNIPANTENGKKLRLKGRGLPATPAGDQYVIIQVVLPKVENKEHEAVFRQMKKITNFNPRKHLGG